MTLSEINDDLLATFFKHGFRIHPNYIGSDNKIHALKQWPSRAASNMEELGKLVEEASKSGEVQRFGVVPPEHCMIVDLDVRDGKMGLQNYEDLVKTHGITATPLFQVKSKSGGFHLYFKTASKFVKTVSNVAKYDGVDIRGQGGFVYAPYRAGELDTWKEGEYLLFDYCKDFARAIPFDDRKLFLEHTVADEKKYLADDIRHRSRALTRLPKGGRDESLHFCVHECYRCGYSEEEAHEYLNWLITICDQDGDIAALRTKFHDIIEKLFSEEKRLVMGATVELDVVVRAMRSAEIYALRAEQKNAISYMALHPNSFNMTPFQPYGRDVFADILNMYSVADADGKIKPSSKAILPRSSAILPSVDRRGFVPNASVTVFKEPESGAECINTYKPTFNDIEAQALAVRSDPGIWINFCNFLEHLFGDKANMALQMTAWMVHRPDRKMISAPIFISEVQGVGKDTFIAIVSALIGHSYIQRFDQASQLIDSKINLSKSLLLYIKELQLGKGLSARNEVEKLGSRLKSIITEPVQRCEEKFMQPYDARSFCNVAIASNRSTVAQLIEPSDRRYNVFDCIPTLSLDNFQAFDPMAELVRTRDAANLAALWLNLRDVKAEFIFDKNVAPNDDHKNRMLNRELEPVDQFLLDNLPDGFTQHLCAYMLARAGMCDPRDAFTKAEYFIRNGLRRHFTPLKAAGTSSNWQFSGCRTFTADSNGVSWRRVSFKPPRPYVYVRINSPVAHALMSKADNSFWKAIEEIFEEVISRPGMASMTDELTGSREAMLAGVQSFIAAPDLASAKAATKLFDARPGVH